MSRICIALRHCALARDSLARWFRADIAKIKASIDYAKAHGGIEVGAYDLIALTRNPPNASWAEISPETGGHDGNACFASAWRDFREQQMYPPQLDFPGVTPPPPRAAAAVSIDCGS